MNAKPITSVAAVFLGSAALFAPSVRASSPAGWVRHPQLQQAASLPNARGPITEGMRIFIEAQRAPFAEGQPVYVVFHERNVSAGSAVFGRERYDWQNNFRVDVTTEHGTPVLLPDDDWTRSGGISPTFDRLEPGQEFVMIGDLRSHYDLAPGTYYVRARRPVEKLDGSGEWVDAVSNTIKITVALPRRGGPTKGLVLGLSAWKTYEASDGVVAQCLRLTNSGDHDIEMAAKQRQAWFHDVTLDLTTLAGDPVPRRRGPDGEELSVQEDGSGPYNYRGVIAGPIRPGDNLDGRLLLYSLYQLAPGTAYTLTAHLTLQTSDGPIELTSNTITFAVKAN